MENPVLKVVETHLGRFYKAEVNGHSISKAELFDVLECEDDGYRISKYVENFKINKPNWIVSMTELDVS